MARVKVLVLAEKGGCLPCEAQVELIQRHPRTKKWGNLFTGKGTATTLPTSFIARRQSPSTACLPMKSMTRTLGLPLLSATSSPTTLHPSLSRLGSLIFKKPSARYLQKSIHHLLGSTISRSHDLSIKSNQPTQSINISISPQPAPPRPAPLVSQYEPGLTSPAINVAPRSPSFT
jgi:hypothetical protein